MARADAGVRGASVYSLLRRASAKPLVPRGVLHGGVGGHPRAVCAECGGHGGGGGQRTVDAEGDVSVRLLSAGAGGGAGHGAGSDAEGEARYIWRGRGAGVVLRGDLDGGADAGGELGSVEVGQVSEFGVVAVGADAAGDLPSVNGFLFPAGLCGEAAADAALLLGGSGGGGVRRAAI